MDKTRDIIFCIFKLTMPKVSHSETVKTITSSEVQVTPYRDAPAHAKAHGIIA
jgi:hypothetical protein